MERVERVCVSTWNCQGYCALIDSHLVKGNPLGGGTGLGGGEGDAKDGVGAHVGLVGGAVESKHDIVDTLLVGGVHANNLGPKYVVDVLDSLKDALPKVSIPPIPELNSLIGSSGGSRRDTSAEGGPGVEGHINLDGGIAAGVKDLTGHDPRNFSGEDRRR